MKQSFSYYLTLWVIKIKKVKKNFSKIPIDFYKIRKEDVRTIKPNFFKNCTTSFYKILLSEVTKINQNKKSNSLVLFIHGGAFISGPAQHHWDSIKTILKNTNHNVWLCNYPKAPEHKIVEISNNIDAVYQAALELYDSQNILLIGDSVGGTLVTALVQRLLKNNIKTPKKVVLISPVMDATMTNPKINEIDLIDPMLSKNGVLSAKQMTTEKNQLSNEMISPINGSFIGFPKTILFLASNDITYPDQEIAVVKMKNENVDLEIIYGENMPHIWPLLPVMKEAKTALKILTNHLN